jgi:hypothetical protein
MFIRGHPEEVIQKGGRGHPAGVTHRQKCASKWGMLMAMHSKKIEMLFQP